MSSKKLWWAERGSLEAAAPSAAEAAAKLVGEAADDCASGLPPDGDVAPTPALRRIAAYDDDDDDDDAGAGVMCDRGGPMTAPALVRVDRVGEPTGGRVGAALAGGAGDGVAAAAPIFSSDHYQRHGQLRNNK